MGVALAFGRDIAARLMREEVGNGGLGAGIDDVSAVLRGEKGGVPVFHAVAAEAAVVGQDNEGGEVLIQRAEAVAHPTSRAGEARKQEAGGLQERGLRVDTAFTND